MNDCIETGLCVLRTCLWLSVRIFIDSNTSLIKYTKATRRPKILHVL